jgi:hypothetical protein
MNMEELKAYLISEVGRMAGSLSGEAAHRQRLAALDTLALRLRELPDDHPNLFFAWYAWHQRSRRTGSPAEPPAATTARLIDGYGHKASDNGDPVQFLRALIDLLEPAGADG